MKKNLWIVYSSLFSFIIFFHLIGCVGSAPTFALNVAVGGAGNGTVTSDTGGIQCNNTGGTCTANFTSGTMVTLTAAAAPGFIFQGWSGGGCKGAGTCQVTLNAETSVRASFVMIVFQSRRNLDGSNTGAANAVNNIWVMKTDGTGLTALTQVVASGAHSYDPRWSPDGTKIAFDSRRNLDGSNTGVANVAGNIWVINADGTGLTALTQVTATDAGNFEPRWSPDGTKILFTSFRNLDGSNTEAMNVSQNIWVMNSDGTGLTALTHVPTADPGGFFSLNLAWSPDGTKIAFNSFRNLDGTDSGAANAAYNIWVMNSDGTGLIALTQVTATRADNLIPEWSPDGTKIMFDSHRNLDGSNTGIMNAASNIWVINADGTSLVALTQVSADLDLLIITPQWSPDGTKVIFSSERNLDGTNTGTGNFSKNVWVMNSNGTGLTALTQVTVDDADSLAPHWFPDGTKILFSSKRNLDGTNSGIGNAAYNIWVMNSDGTGLTALSQVTAADADSFSIPW